MTDEPDFIPFFKAEAKRLREVLSAIEFVIAFYEGDAKANLVEAAPAPQPVRVTETPKKPAVEKIDLRKGPRVSGADGFGGVIANVWTDAELAILIDLVAQKKHPSEAFAKLPGRTPAAIRTKFHTIKQRVSAGKIKVEKPVEQKVDRPAPTIKTLPPAPPSKPVEYKIPAESGYYSDKAVLMRLRNLGHVDPWSPDLDAELVELLLTGTKAGQAAEILEIPKDQCVARFKRLCPDDGIDSQRQVLRLLKELAKVPA